MHHPALPLAAPARSCGAHAPFLLRPTAVATALAVWLLAGTGAFVAAPAHAQTQPQSAAAADHSYAIAAGALAPALTQFAKTSGVLLAYTPDLVQGRSTPGLQGRHAPPQALATLLGGTGLQAVVADNGTYTLRRAPAPAAAAAVTGATGATGTIGATGGLTLGEVRVTAQALANDGTSEGTGSYTATGPSGAATGLNLSLRETPQSITVMS
ncbi:MAG: TonB-dependent siderophore receptor, partial [Comamonadaceae bacterium]